MVLKDVALIREILKRFYGDKESKNFISESLNIHRNTIKSKLDLFSEDEVIAAIEGNSLDELIKGKEDALKRKSKPRKINESQKKLINQVCRRYLKCSSNEQALNKNSISCISNSSKGSKKGTRSKEKYKEVYGKYVKEAHKKGLSVISYTAFYNVAKNYWKDSEQETKK